MSTDLSPSGTEPPHIKPADLRGILEYVPLFRGQTFVLSVDGSVVDDANFANLLLDIAVLRSLHIRVVLVHGIGRQIKALAREKGIELSNAYGQGPTDEATLKLALQAAAGVSQQVVQGLTRAGLTCSQSNAVRATERGVLGGTDLLRTGKVDKVDTALLRRQLEMDIVPLFSPIAFDRQGEPLRLNSDHLAARLAVELEASKLIYMVPHRGLTVDGEFIMNAPVEEVEKLLDERGDSIDERVRSKAEQAVKTIRAGVPRAHILDGRVHDGLLNEIFSKVGIGTMIHGNAYQQIRPAQVGDASAISGLLRQGSRDESLRARSPEEIEHTIDRFFVYEIDESLIGCVSLLPYGDEVAELSGVFVLPFYQGKGVGRKLVEYTLLQAKERGYTRLFALTTQSAGFFREVCGFTEASATELPPERRSALETSGRHSRVLVKEL